MACARACVQLEMCGEWVFRKRRTGPIRLPACDRTPRLPACAPPPNADGGRRLFQPVSTLARPPNLSLSGGLDASASVRVDRRGSPGNPHRAGGPCVTRSMRDVPTAKKGGRSYRGLFFSKGGNRHDAGRSKDCKGGASWWWHARSIGRRSRKAKSRCRPNLKRSCWRNPSTSERRSSSSDARR